MRFHFTPIEMSSRFYRTKCLIKVKIFRYFFTIFYHKKTRHLQKNGLTCGLVELACRIDAVFFIRRCIRVSELTDLTESVSCAVDVFTGCRNGWIKDRLFTRA